MKRKQKTRLPQTRPSAHPPVRRFVPLKGGGEEYFRFRSGVEVWARASILFLEEH